MAPPSLKATAAPDWTAKLLEAGSGPNTSVPATLELYTTNSRNPMGEPCPLMAAIVM